MRPGVKESSSPVRVKQYEISEDLFTKGYPAGGGPCRCTSICCRHGVFVDIRERDRILAQRTTIAVQMDATQVTDDRQWFTGYEHDDADFPSGRCAESAVVNGKCAFLDGQGRCSLQKAGETGGLGAWTLKPLYCILYPIEVSDGVVGFDPMLQDEEPCCTVTEEFDIPLFRACRDELTHLLGPDGYRQLEDAYTRIRPGITERRTA